MSDKEGSHAPVDVAAGSNPPAEPAPEKSPAEIEWDTRVAEVQALAKKIEAFSNVLMDNGVLEPVMGWHNIVINTVIPELQRRAGEGTKLDRYAAYHCLVGSTTKFEYTPEVDLPDGTIVKLMKEIIARLRQVPHTHKFEL